MRQRRQLYKKKITPKNDAPFKRNDHPAPATSTTIPPNAGPTARATLNPAEFSATAEACRCAETTSGVIACHAGSFITAPNPMRKVKPATSMGLRCRRASVRRVPLRRRPSSFA